MECFFIKYVTGSRQVRGETHLVTFCWKIIVIPPSPYEKFLNTPLTRCTSNYNNSEYAMRSYLCYTDKCINNSDTALSELSLNSSQSGVQISNIMY